MNRAFDGDIVAVELLPQDQWHEAESSMIADDGIFLNKWSFEKLTFSLQYVFISSFQRMMKMMVFTWLQAALMMLQGIQKLSKLVLDRRFLVPTVHLGGWLAL